MRWAIRIMRKGVTDIIGQKENNFIIKMNGNNDVNNRSVK